jgi:hypothetical protein
MVSVPILLGVKVTEQEFEAPLPPPGAGMVQVLDGEKLPPLLGATLQFTLPVGVM